ncbi:MAG: aminoacyl--tRNA ligase-related protein [bacterium]|nr:aminoacyl--tRNA ligase-related protein [bacterium]
MLQSQLFSKTTKNLPEGETAKNAQLLIKAGFINKSSAGVYSFLPLGLRVLNKINQIIREEMNAIGGEELLLPSLVQRKYWEKSGRWDVDIIYKTGAVINQRVLRGDFEYGLGWTHEEVVGDIARHFIQSYKDLPKAVYQIQTKFRAEARAQAGLLRGREFLMKDLYSFHANTEDLNSYYQLAIGAYKKIFKRLGLGAIVTEAGGGAFTKEYTHEFQVLNPAGEDVIYYCRQCDFSQNKEIYNASAHKNCNGEIKSESAIEVGNVFKLGTKFSEAFNAQYLDKNGNKNLVIMGSYGIGPTRVMGTIVEQYNDEKGIIWPESVAPFKVHLIELGDSPAVKKAASGLYQTIGQKLDMEVLYDERSASAGEKLNDADLFGIPWRIVISEKTLAAKKIEVKKRSEKTPQLITQTQLAKLLK